MATNAAHETQLYCRVFFKARFFSIQLFFAEFLCPTYASGVTFFFFNSSPPSIGGVRKKTKNRCDALTDATVNVRISATLL